MPLTPKSILEGALEQGRKVVEAGTDFGKRRFSRDEGPTPGLSQDVPPQPGRAGGAKTGTPTPATTRTQRAKKTAPKRAATAKTTAATKKPTAAPRKPAATAKQTKKP